MLCEAFVSQPAGGVNYVDLFRQAFDRATFSRLDAAVAYATTGGVQELVRSCQSCNPTGWKAMEKRFVVGIDYCRTEPLALYQLQSIPNSRVRIHAGDRVVDRKQCTPVLPFHPKVYLLHGSSAIAAICGSGNLSRNGLTKGHEVGNIMLTKNPSDAAENLIKDACNRLSEWYESIWSEASKVTSVLPKYEKIFEATEHLRAPSLTDDDAGDTNTLGSAQHNRHALSPVDLRRLRVCKHLWLEAGTLTKNRGPLLPGNQLMLTRMTRVFFGFPARDLHADTAIGEVAITYDGDTRDDCSIVFSNNLMDKLTVPVPGNGGPLTYDNKNLLFTKTPAGKFVLSLGSGADKAAWKRASVAIEGYKKMSSGRQWGVF